MILAELKTIVESHLSQEFDSLYSQFVESSGKQSTEDFAEYLLIKQLISKDLYESIKAQEGIELTSIDQIIKGTSPLNPIESAEATMLNDIDHDSTKVIGEDADATMAAGAAARSGQKSQTAILDAFEIAERDRYSMLGSVGQGAMGEILLARDQDLQRKVAYKKIHKQMSSNQKVLSRFLVEAQITAQLDHPNIIPIYSLEISDDGEVAYSMKLIQGRDFKEILTEAKRQYQVKGRPEEDYQLSVLLDHFLKVCDAMHYAHMKGVIHRDLKPANIMIGPYNEVYVMDWGIARVMGKAEDEISQDIVELIQPDSDEPEFERTQLGQILGTPRYMSPQQAAGKNDDLDGRSDLFALGLILFEIVTLKPAFTAKTSMELLKKVLKVQLEPFKHFSSKVKVPVELEAIILKATARKVDGRYASVEEFADDIRRYLRGEEVVARPDTPIQKMFRWMSHHRQATLAIVMSILLICATAIMLSLYLKQLALTESQRREHTMSEFLTIVARKSQQIDSHFLEFEASLEGLAAVTTESLMRGKESKTPFYFAQEFSINNKTPADIRNSPKYGKAISVEWPGFFLTSNTSKEEALPLIKKLSNLKYDFKRLFVQNANDGKHLITEQELNRLIIHDDIPIIWLFTAFEEGIHLAYPGKGGYPETYDPRKRVWYQSVKDKHGLFWGKPYLDASGQGLLLPCSTALYSDEGKFLGVAGVDLGLNYVIGTLMNIEKMPSVKNTYLLNEKGQIVVESTDKEKLKELTEINHPAFQNQKVIEAVLSKKSGHLEDLEQGASKIIAYYRLNALGWYYVVEADTEQLLSS